MKIFINLELLMRIPDLWETVLSTKVEKSSEVILESPRETNGGDWGDMELCLTGTYATAMQMKVHPYKKDIDNSGSTGIKLFCTNLSLRARRSFFKF